MSQHLAARHRFRRLAALLCILALLLTSLNCFANALALYNLMGTKLIGGIRHLHYSFNNTSGYTNTYGINYLTQALGASNSWGDQLRSSNGQTVFTYTTPSTSCDIRFQFAIITIALLPAANTTMQTEINYV